MKATRKLKKLAERKARAEIREIKERIKERKNPFGAVMSVTDKLPKIIDAAIYLGLAYTSLQTFGKYEEEETYIEKVPYKERVISESPFSLPSGRTAARTISTITKYRDVKKTRKVTKYHPVSALTLPVAYKLAQSDNLAAGTVGTSVLAAGGIIAVAGEPVSQWLAGIGSEWEKVTRSLGYYWDLGLKGLGIG